MAGYSKKQMTIRGLILLVVWAIIGVAVYLFVLPRLYPAEDEIIAVRDFKFGANASFMAVIPVYGGKAVWPAPKHSFTKTDEAGLYVLPQAEYYYALHVYEPFEILPFISRNDESLIVMAAIDRHNRRNQYRHTKTIVCPLERSWKGYYGISEVKIESSQVKVDFCFRFHLAIWLGLAVAALLIALLVYRLLFYGPIRDLSKLKKETAGQ